MGAAYRATYVKPADALFFSAYLPDSGRPIEDYEATVKHIHSIVRSHRGSGSLRRRIVFGGDLHVSMLRNIVSVTGATVD